VRRFEHPTLTGESRQLQRLARRALSDYPLEAGLARITAVARSFNTVFRIEEAGGRTLALRVGPAERIHAEGTELVEARWMRALRAEASLAVPDVIDAADGMPVVRTRHPDVPGERACMLFEWVRGRRLSTAMTEARARELGALAALLHDHASSAAAPGPPPVLVADRALYWRVPDRLGELGWGALLDDARERAEGATAALWSQPPHPPHLLHGDLTADNVLISGNGLVPIDFQDLVGGFDVQDLAITHAALDRFPDCGRLSCAFRHGYEARRRWPDPEPTLFAALIAGRRLHQLNLTLALRSPGPGLERIVARAHRRTLEWLQSCTA
jgi:Ser/Thr protein kinase RdoA (MazF antagonist)